MVDQHASQCGFCTPGFVMSLFALYLRNPAPTREQVLEALSGNLCRCTGYRPIIAAGLHMGEYPPAPHWNRDTPMLAARLAQLHGLQRTAALRIPGFFAPRSVDELAAELARNPAARVLAGGTDVGLWVTKQLRELPDVVYIGAITDLRHIRREDDILEIGAAVSLTESWRALVAEFPALAEMAQRFASPPVCNSGTLCGNLANGSPIGDSLPVLIALNAELVLRRGMRTRRLPLERFYLGYQRTALEPGEFIVSVRVPVSQEARSQWIAAYKVSKRIDQDISAVAAALAVRVEEGRVASARIALGGMAAVAARAVATEGALVGSAWTRATIEAAVEKLAEDFEPLTDMRASSTYRMRAAGNLLRRFYLEHGGSAGPTRTVDMVAVSV
jgi:xanthine dehydrogenase small subunit